MSLIYETDHFIVQSSVPPHVSRRDGGHMIIVPKVPVKHRWEFDPARAKALMRISMMAGEAMLQGLNERAIPVERLNFQDNGNWAIGTAKGPSFHLHLYGRASDSISQTHGEALRFPPKSTRFYDHLEPLNEDDEKTIKKHLDQLAREERYSLSVWGIEAG